MKETRSFSWSSFQRVDLLNNALKSMQNAEKQGKQIQGATIHGYDWTPARVNCVLNKTGFGSGGQVKLQCEALLVCRISGLWAAEMAVRRESGGVDWKKTITILKRHIHSSFPAKLPEPKCYGKKFYLPKCYHRDS